MPDAAVEQNGHAFIEHSGRRPGCPEASGEMELFSGSKFRWATGPMTKGQ